MEQRPDLPENGERLDYVPWSAFDVSEDRRSVTWTMVAAAIIVAAAVGLLVVGGGEDEPGRLEVVPPPEPAAELPTTTAATLLSEADLRASPPYAPSAIAAMAESFVFGYFTVDPDRSTGAAAEMAAALGPLPGPTYVEWVGAEDVTEIEPRSFEAVVRFRLIILGDVVAREEEAVVAVRIVVTDEGPVVPAPPVLMDAAPVRIAEDWLEEATVVVAGPGRVPVLGQP